MKKLFLLFVAMCYMMTFNAYAIGGKCGENVKWEMDKSGTVTISGTGFTYDYGVGGDKNKSPFYDKEKIKRIVIEEGVTGIGKELVSLCYYVTSISIPKSVTYIHPKAIEFSRNLNTITVHPQNPKYCDIDGVLFTKDRKTLVAYPCGKGADYTIPEGTVTIGASAFYTAHLLSVQMPNTVTTIEKQAFERSYIQRISFSWSLKTIEEEAFAWCGDIKEILLPPSVTTIARDAFRYCSKLTNFMYPKGLDISSAGVPSTAASAYNPQSAMASTTPAVSTSSTTPSTTPSSSTGSKGLPLLTMVEGSLEFVDATNNNCIDAAEKCLIRFQVVNNGKGAANNCEARITIGGASAGITAQNIQLPSISAGQTRAIEIPINSSISTEEGRAIISIEVFEPNGMGVAPFDLTVATKAYEPPFLQVVDYSITSTSGKIRKMEPFTLTFNLQNTRYGDAETVHVKINLPANVFVMDGNAELSYPLIKSGEVKSIQITLAANNNYATTNIPVTIDIQEKYGKFAQNKSLDIALNQTTANSINIAAKTEPHQERKEIQLALMSSDVDRDIPHTSKENKNTFVVIIANENYDQVASVPFALNDGKIFRQYCEQTLGIPAKNIHIEMNATGGKIRAQIDWLQNVVNVFKQNNPSVIFYYAGHGIPDEASKSAFLLPVDGIVSNLNTCFKLDELYATLGSMPAERISVFMDACFSGSKRENGMLASARAVALKTRPGEPQGKMVVFSAAQGDETAYPYREKQHGMFTYYLLKKLQETQGNVSFVELGEYVTTHVQQQSVLENSKVQTPCVTPSTAVVDNWRSWTLK